MASQKHLLRCSHPGCHPKAQAKGKTDDTERKEDSGKKEGRKQKKEEGWQLKIDLFLKGLSLLFVSLAFGHFHTKTANDKLTLCILLIIERNMKRFCSEIVL